MIKYNIQTYNLKFILNICVKMQEYIDFIYVTFALLFICNIRLGIYWNVGHWMQSVFKDYA